MKFYILLLSFIAFLNIGNAQVYYVDIDATGNNNGSSWVDAYTDLQDAIDAATLNQEIWVAAGTYFPTKDHTGNASPTDLRDKNFHLNTDMKIYGGFAGNETLLSERDLATNVSILSGDINNDDVVTGGGSTLSFSNNTENVYHVIITANLTSAAIIDGFTIIGGNANGVNSVVYESISYDRGFGGGMYNKNSSSPTIINSTIANNSTDSWGGGIYNTGSSSPKVINSILSKNNAGSGGGMGNSSSAPVITNTIFANNNSGNGGAIFNFSSSPMLTNSIIWGNGSTELSANSSSVPSFMNSIIKGSGGSENWDTDYGADNGANLDADPRFVDDSNSDYNLQMCSPAIATGDNTAWTNTGLSTDIAGNPRPFNDLIVDIGALEYQSTQFIISIAEPIVTQPTCAPTGTIVIAATATMGTLTYSIDNGMTYQSNPTFSGLLPGSYTIKVQGENISCTETYSGNPVIINPAFTGAIYVDINATGNNDGTSWTDAYQDLQDAIDNQCGGLDIWVAVGTYLPSKNHLGNTPSDDRDKNFHLGTDMKIYGGFAGVETELSARNAETNITILSGDFLDDDVVTGSGGSLSISGQGENTYHVIVTANLTAAAILDGFTIKGGNAYDNGSVTSFTYQSEIFYEGYGGGMYNSSSSPTITNVTLTINDATDGGGMYNSSSSPVITNTVFEKNRGTSYGGAMYNTSSSTPTITNSTFSNNRVVFEDGGGMYNSFSSPMIRNSSFTNNDARYGGGICNNSSSPTITSSTFSNNEASRGGAIYNDSDSPTILNSTFTNNQASIGGAMYNYYCSLTITNSRFSNNQASDSGGGMYNAFSSVTITNSTFSNNLATSEGGGLYNYNSTSMVTNSILWDNGISPLSVNSDFPIFKNSIIQGSGGSVSWNATYGTDNGGNLDIDPLFVDAANDDYSISGCSPAINTGATVTHTTDILGNPHVGIVDIGAYEFQDTPIMISITTPTVTQPNCAVGTGTIVVNASTSAGTLEYSIDNGMTYQPTATFCGLSAANYSTKVQEVGSSCSATYNSNPVVILPLMTVIAPTITQPTCDVTSGTIVVNTTTSASILEYSIDDGMTYQSSAIFSGLAGGSYTIKVREQGLECAQSYPNNPVVINTPYVSEIYVNVNATGNNDGSSWTDAYTDLQDAIDNQCGGFDIWVAAGTYLPTKDHTGNETPTNNRDKNFHIGTDMKIYGGFVGTETQLSERNIATNVTILSGDFNNNDVVTGGGVTLTFSGNSENAYHVMITINLTNATFIDGFSIKGGNANGSGGISFESDFAYQEFQRNFGGGLYSISGYQPTIINSHFTNNSANSGGGMYINDGEHRIINSSIVNNKASNGGGGIFNFFGDIHITNSTVANNNASTGGGLYYEESSSPSITNSIIWDNGNSEVLSSESEPSIKNSIIKGSGGSANWNIALGTDEGGNLDTAPLFIDELNGNYSLHACSPAINAGATVTHASDILGNPHVGVVDIGAYEYQGPSEISVNTPTVTQPTCADLTGTIVVNASTSEGTLEYSIDNGITYQATAIFSGLSAANYIIKVHKVGSSCSEIYGSNPVVISPLLVTDPMITQPNCLPSGTIVVNTTTTESILEYSIDDGVTYQDSATFSGLLAGYYSIIVREQGLVCTQSYPNNPVVINTPYSSEIYVNANAIGNNDGSSWADAYIDLQDAMDNQCGGLDIWVATGTYLPTKDHTGNKTPTDNRDKNFHLSTDMKIYGGFAGTEIILSERNWATNETIISGDFNSNDTITGGGSTLAFSGNDENAYHVMITANLTNATVIDGFTIKGGNANGTNSVVYGSASFNRGYGGAMYNKNSSAPKIKNSIITNNNANVRGGGIYNTGASSPTVINSIFSYNNANDDGGGMANSTSSPIITNSTFANNNALDNGGGIYNQSSSPMITNSIFWDNGNTEVYFTSTLPTFKSSIIKGSGGSDNWNTAFGTDYGGNLDADPLFVDEVNGDFSLSGSSPAINAGDGIFGISLNTDTLDLAAYPRFVDEIDMGAYENQCKEHLVLGVADSPLSGIYQAKQTITISGAVEVLSGVAIELTAPKVTVDDSMIINLDAVIHVTPAGCN